MNTKTDKANQQSQLIAILNKDIPMTNLAILQARKEYHALLAVTKAAKAYLHCNCVSGEGKAGTKEALHTALSTLNALRK